ncbi:DUF2291 domain-containing protein [bacterium]|nr:DUF2291 domain-containing protein [bacterium]
MQVINELMIRLRKTKRKSLKNTVLTIAIFCLSFLILASSSCTVVDNEEDEKDDSKLDIYFVDDTFKAEEYVSGIWDSKVVPYFQTESIDLKKILTVYENDPEKAGITYGYREKTEGSPWTFKVKGTGTIIKAKTKSQAAVMEIDLEPMDGKKDAIIQIGPVIKGSSIRDALDFVTFGMFTNQIEYAQLANALNRKAYDTELSKFDRETIVGKDIYFEGAFTQVPYSSKVLITPVKLEVK